MRGFRSTGESDEDLELDESQKPSPGKKSLTAGLVARSAASSDDRASDTRGINALLERGGGGGGAPLPENLRGSFEDSLGVRLADVRVHTGGESAEAATSVNARAFTVGQDIHFADGQYNPGTAAGKHLLAHEVAHTAQQRGGSAQVQTKLEVTKAGDAVEGEADRAADAMVAGQKASVSAVPIAMARAPGDEGPAPVGPADNGTDATQLAGGVKVTVKVNRKAGSMEYDAADYNELYRQVSKRADGHKCAGSCECGAAQISYPDRKQVGEKIHVTSMSIAIDVTVAVPTWKQKASQPKADQDKFDAWAASVSAHEEKHFKIYNDGFNKMKTLITGPTEEECDTQYEAQKTQMETDQDVVDEPANQPAPLAAPGGMIKVPATP
jgi:hypothetical protein